MTEEYNPYLRSDDQQPKAAPFAQPTPAPSAPDPQPPFQRTAEMPRPVNAVPPQPGNPVPPPPVTPGRPPQFNPPVYPVKKNPHAAAKAFGMVSFIIGCFVLPVTSMIYFNFHSTVSQKFGYSILYSVFLSIPALVFGVVSLMKKTEKRLFPILGIAFGTLLMLCAFITYFFMVNGTPNVY